MSPLHCAVADWPCIWGRSLRGGEDNRRTGKGKEEKKEEGGNGMAGEKTGP